MRVSDSMMYDLATRGVGSAQQKLFGAQEVASTGVRVSKPSDDPVAASLTRGYRSRERRADTVAKLSSEAVDRLQVVDDTLQQVNDVLSRARELGVQAANDTLSGQDRAGAATEVRQLRQQLLALANTRVEGEYLFGGMAVDTEPFDASGTFQGESLLREIDVGQGVRMATQLSGEDAFGPPGGADAFAVLDALVVALDADDTDAVHGLLGDMDTMTNQVAGVRSYGGSLQQSLLQARATAERTRDQAMQRRSALIDADPASAFTDLVKAETALRAALAIASRMPPPSLVGGG